VTRGVGGAVTREVRTRPPPAAEQGRAADPIRRLAAWV
jgi:hypothetical protein